MSTSEYALPSRQKKLILECDGQIMIYSGTELNFLQELVAYGT